MQCRHITIKLPNQLLPSISPPALASHFLLLACQQHLKTLQQLQVGRGRDVEMAAELLAEPVRVC